MITSGLSGAMPSSQLNVGSGRPFCSSGSQPLRKAPSDPRRATSERTAATTSSALRMVTGRMSTRRSDSAGAMPSSQLNVGSGRPFCSSGSQPLRKAPSDPRRATSERTAATTSSALRMVTGRMSTRRSDSATASISGCPCASTNPGMTQPSPTSTVWVGAPVNSATSARVPTAMMRPSATASASAVGRASSTVRMVPVTTRSASAMGRNRTDCRCRTGCG